MPVEPPQVITFQLNFGFDKYTIVDEMVPTLEQALLILKEKPGRNFEIAGHTDNIGPKDYNQKLSERRANSVAQWLIKNGIDAKRLTVVGYGLTRPKADNATREGRKINRRVEITSVK
jgi:OOP family OmpA-OmpF porin